jgi:hypothetical protein
MTRSAFPASDRRHSAEQVTGQRSFTASSLRAPLAHRVYHRALASIKTSIGVVTSAEERPLRASNGVTSIVRRDLESISERVMG